MKVMAKIAYKEWKEKKMEDNRQQKKKEKLERRNRFINDDGDDHGHKKGEVMLAYGLNKNLKKIRERPKSAKPSKKNKNKKKEI